MRPSHTSMLVAPAGHWTMPTDELGEYPDPVTVTTWPSDSPVLGVTDTAGVGVQPAIASAPAEASVAASAAKRLRMLSPHPHPPGAW